MRTALLVLAAVLLCGCRPSPAAAPALVVSSQQQAVLDDAGALRDGDLVFRRGRDVMSALVLRQGRHSRFSHVGMVMRQGDQVMVVHAMPEEPGSAGGVLIEPLAQFLHPRLASDAASYRLPVNDAAALRQWLQAQVGLPFDMRFELSDAGALYCTELVVRALQAGGLPVQAQTIATPLLAEPVITPDALRQLPGLQLLAGQ